MRHKSCIRLEKQIIDLDAVCNFWSNFYEFCNFYCRGFEHLSIAEPAVRFQDFRCKHVLLLLGGHDHVRVLVRLSSTFFALNAGDVVVNTFGKHFRVIVKSLLITSRTPSLQLPLLRPLPGQPLLLQPLLPVLHGLLSFSWAIILVYEDVLVALVTYIVTLILVKRSCR